MAIATTENHSIPSLLKIAAQVLNAQRACAQGLCYFVCVRCLHAAYKVY